MPSMKCGCKRCREKFGTKVRARKDCIGNWQARYTAPDGRGLSETFETEDEGIAFLERTREEIRQRKWIDPTRAEITLTTWRITWRGLQTGEEATLDRDDRLWRNHIEPHFGGWRICDIAWSDVQAWVNNLDGPLAPSSVTKVFQVLDRMLAAALRDRRLPFNPADSIKLPKIKKQHPEDRRPPTYVQLRAVRRKLPDYHFTLQIVAQETGLRWGELAGLRACWVDLPGTRIQVREVLSEVNGKLSRKAYPKENASLRTVPLTPLAVRVLRAHLAAEQPSLAQTEPDDGLHPEELVFHGRNRRQRGTGAAYRAPLRRSAFRRLWITAIEQAGVMRKTVRKLPDGGTRTDYWPDFHDQRHAFASRLHGCGVPEVIVQEVLGHERGGEVTWLYTHAAADVAGQVLAALRGDPVDKPRLRAVA
ncbi:MULTISPECIES: tyrosine-type recombinase/integrase [unclassified Kitasatospora]|uniref:tyrosine-type recombinase/integrase n=1 Tax=unclassified Kitasatospora TaxID=2633591 RepID=UPI002475A21A|nr:site-specific integrase [Kitasatospora sp. MAP12-44]